MLSGNLGCKIEKHSTERGVTAERFRSMLITNRTVNTNNGEYYALYKYIYSFGTCAKLLHDRHLLQ